MASIATAYASNGVSVGGVFGRSADVIKTNPVATLGTTFVLMALPQLLLQQTQLRASLLQDFQSGDYSTAGSYGFASAILWLIASGALVQATVAHGQGRKADLAEVLRTGVLRLLPLFGVYLLVVFGVAMGMILLFIPGIILGVMWSVALPAVVAERTGVFGALGRSRALTKGARWQVFGILLLALAIYMVASIAVALLGVAGSGIFAALANGTATPSTSIVAQLVQSVVTTVMVTWYTTVGASLFVELRNWKNGPDADRLADIFA